MPKRTMKVIKDAQGHEYPLSIIDKNIIQRDRVVKRLVSKAEKLSAKIAVEKDKMEKELNKYLQKVAKEYGLHWKGNAQLISFDERFKIEVNISERLDYNEKLQLAKQLIDNCINRWSENANANLKAIVINAFNVDKKGKISLRRVLSLRKYRIKDKEWEKAMELINESLSVVFSKQYINFYKKDADGKWEQVKLNFSAI